MVDDKEDAVKSPFSINIPGKEIDRSLAEILTAMLHPVAAEVGSLLRDTVGIASDRIRMKRERNTQLGMDQVRTELNKAGIAIDAITPPKEEELHLLISGLSLTDDEHVRKLWAGLFAQALIPDTSATAERPFISVLESLSPMDAKIIDFLAFVLRTEADLKNELQRIAPGDPALSAEEEGTARAAANLHNHELRQNAVRCIEDKASEYGLDVLAKGDWSDNLIRQGIIERAPYQIQKPSLPRPSRLDDRAVGQFVQYFAQRFELLDKVKKYDTAIPSGVLSKNQMQGQFILSVALTSFGMRLAKSCRLI